LPVAEGAELVARVVAVHQVDPAGDGLDPVHDAGQVLAAGVGVAGVQAEPDLAGAGPVAGGQIADGIPEALQCGQAPGHRVVAAGGVLDQQGYRPFYPLDRLAPVGVSLAFIDAAGDVAAVHDQALRADRSRGGELLAQQLAAGDTDPVVRAGHVDAVRRVDEDLEARLVERSAKLARVTAGERGRAPALGVTEEELDDLGTGGARHRQRITFTVVRTNANHAPERRAGAKAPRRRNGALRQRGVRGVAPPEPALLRTRTHRARSRGRC